MMPKVLAVVPAFNEEGRIVAVVSGLRQRGFRVVVIDDGSADATAQEAEAAGAAIVAGPNRGKGNAILRGCRWAIERGYDRVLLLDGDGQHDPAEAWRMVAAGNDADLVIGRRGIDAHRQPPLRRCANRMSSLLVTLAAGRRFNDSQSGYRLCDPRKLLTLPIRGRRYDFESEMCILAARNGWRINEVAIRVIYNDKVSGMHPWYDTVRFLRAVYNAGMALHRLAGRRVVSRMISGPDPV